jgi:outer membrane receptor protein involved in Fe transport
LSTVDERPISLEAVTVTGSNIRRADAETAVPVSVIEAAELNARGASTMADLMETLNIAEPSGITELNNGAQAARGDVASVDLRGLGTGSTLVLINGRRMAPHPISMAENGVPALAPNINAVPRALIGRVEVLRDGASAIYGADAAAGVINNLVSRTVVGRGVTLRGSLTQHGGAHEVGATLFDSFQRGKAHVSVAFDHFRRDGLAADDRKFSRDTDFRTTRKLPAPWNGLPMVDAAGATVRDNDFANSNPLNQWGQWQRGFIQPDYLTFVGSRPPGNTGITLSTAPPTGVATMAANGMFYLWPNAEGSVNFKQTAPVKNIDSPENATFSNFNRWRMLIPGTNRSQFAVFVDRPLDDRIDFFGDLLLYHAYSTGRREGVDFKNSGDPGLYVPASNPWNPFGVRFYHPTGAPNADGTPRIVGTPADVSAWNGVSPGMNANPYLGMRPRELEVTSYSWRMLGGLRGKLRDSWEWESALLLAGSQTHEYDHFQVRESRMRLALLRTDSTALNLFPVTFKIQNNQVVADRLFINPAAVIEPLYDDEDRFGRTNLLVWDAKINGRLWRLFRGGEIGLATGAEFRYETYDDKRAVFVGLNPPGSGSQYPIFREGDNDIVNLSGNVPLSARQWIYAAYAEAAFPFVTRENRVPLVEALELTLAGRFEHFQIFGKTTKPKASLVWKPAPWLKLRGSASESFRAPNLVQTNTTPLSRRIDADDSYRFDVTRLAADDIARRLVFRQGNQTLVAEEAKTWVAGLVVDVPKLRGLSLTFDYFSISQSNVIENVGAQPAIDQDELALQRATQAALARGTPIDQIDLGSGTPNYQGNPKVTRLPLTAADRAAFAGFNAAQPTNATRRAPVGEFVSLIDDYVNLSGRDIQGYEFGFNWRLPTTRFGQISLRGESTHYVMRQTQSAPGASILNDLGKNGRVKWRANAGLNWRQGAWSAGWFTTYFDSFVDTSAATTEPVYVALGRPDYIRVFNDNGIVRYVLKVDPFINHNAWISYQFKESGRSWLKGVTVRGGLNNVLDTEPPLADEPFGFATGTANPRGRQFTVEVAKKF